MYQCGLGCCVPCVLFCCPLEESLDYSESNALAVHVCGRKVRSNDLQSPYISTFCDMITGNPTDLQFLEAPSAPKKYKALPQKGGKINLCELGCRGKMLQIDQTEGCGQESTIAAIRAGNIGLIEENGKITRQEFYEIFMQAMLVLEEDLFLKIATAYADHKGEVSSSYDLQSFRVEDLAQTTRDVK